LSYFSDIVNGAIDKAAEYDQLMVVATVEGSRTTEKDFLIKLSHYMLDGLIYCPVATGEYLEELQYLNHLPLVVAGRRRVLHGITHISTDDEKAGYIATRYLLNLGRKDIGFFAAFWGDPPVEDADELIESIDSPVSGSFSTMDRLRGYRRALSEENLPVDGRKIVFSRFDADAGYESARELFAKLGELDAIIVPNCYAARGVYKFCREQGIEVPTQISLISMDDLKTGELLSIPTTSIIHDMYQVGVESVIRINRILEKQASEDALIDVRLHIRQSTTKK
jgi:LacI family transcriptional regulator